MRHWIYTMKGAVFTGRRILYASLLVIHGVHADAYYSNCTNGNISMIQDGWCNIENNNEQCLYDGGDCCSCNYETSRNDSSWEHFAFCRDPNSGCMDPRVDMYPNCTHGNIPGIGDGSCDLLNNNEECVYDGGDCCECTRTDGGISSYADSVSPFTLCVDPRAPCYNPAAVTLQSNCTLGDIQAVADGNCDVVNNNMECLYDGGDCCECTRIENGSYSSSSSTSSFSLCVDPVAPCYDPAAAVLQANCSSEFTSFQYVGDGSCDPWNNNEGCLYDGGDCCECTVESLHDDDFWKSYTLCKDPTSGCIDPRVEMYPNCTNGDILDIGDGYCDMENNNPECMYDGGDCCACTRSDDDSSFYAENSAFFWPCVDPSAPCFNLFAVDLVKNCTDGDVNYIGDGLCDDANNNPECLYDGGDCCPCTCVHGPALCGVFGFDCVDPSVHDPEDYICVDSPHTSTVCPAVLEREWIVTNATQAQALAEAVVCAGGTFNVKWKGRVVLDKTISIMDGTILNVTGIDSDAVIDGNGKLRLFAVVNASLHLHNVTLSNSFSVFGGAIAASRSTATFDRTTFTGNTASNSGGALYLSNGAIASFNRETTFFNNTALYGGALFVTSGSSASWAGGTTFSRNTAFSRDGGALRVTNHSSVTWNAESRFLANTANIDGGAISLADGCSASWTAKSWFFANSALSNGGAVSVADSSNAAWTAESIFSFNSAQSDGGAVYAGNNGTLLLTNETVFANNTALNGGALFLTNGASAKLSGKTHFTSNSALVDGGAVGSRAIDSELSFSASSPAVVVADEESVVVIKGTTVFENNTCGANGGGMALVQSLAVSFESNAIYFVYNSADIAGGAVFVAGTGIGPVFINVTFVGNFAQAGGGVFVTGSGTTVTVGLENEKVTNPTTFNGCNFVGNVAVATGGAVDSASGRDLFVRTAFSGNEARVGGALRLAGATSIDSCSFDENISETSWGPAVSNSGYMSNVTDSYFRDNVYKCERQMFLDFNKSGDVFGTICDGCPSTCAGCSFGEVQGALTCTSLSQAGIEHATSGGGSTTLEELLIQKGHWRATNTSPNVFECFNTKACTGGVTGATNYCLSGYEGPYCSVCSENYVASLGFTCRECSDNVISIAITVVLSVLAVAFGMAIVSVLMSFETEGAGRGFVYRVTQWIPKQSLKIIIVTWQILTQFTSVANVTFPNVYQRFLDSVDILNFDLSWVVSARCFLEVDFHDRLLWTTITPVITVGVLGATFAVAAYRCRGYPNAILQNARHKHVSMMLLVSFLVYSSVSSVVFQMFACDDLDDGKRYLRADYTIDCDSSRHRAFQIYAGVMILLYPIGIPTLYAGLLLQNHRLLLDGESRKKSLAVRPTLELWKPYKPHRYYYEVIECGRRILLAGVVVFIYPSTAAQIAITLSIAVVFVFVSEGMNPYDSTWDAWLSRTGHAVVFTSMYLALLLKVDVSGENDSSQKTFEMVLVGTHACMVLAVVVETVIIVFSLTTKAQKEDPGPRSRVSTSSTIRNVQAALVEEGKEYKEEP